MLKYKLNKKIVIIIGIILLASGAAFATYAAGFVLFGGGAATGGLVLSMDLAQDNYTSGTRTFKDNSGLGNNGVSLNAATFTTDKYGKSARAMSFNGGDDYVRLADTGALSTLANGSFTISGWAKMINKTSTHNIVRRDNYQNQGGENRRVISLATLVTSGYASFGFYDGSSYVAAGTVNRADGNWHHFVGTYDAASKNIYLYVDGAVEASNLNISPASSFNTAREPYVIGSVNTQGSAGEDMAGPISEVKIYNRALSATEVQALYESSKSKVAAGSLQKGLIAHWALDGDGYNATTGRITDKTPYENHATNNGATLTTDKTGQANGAMDFNGTSGYAESSVPINIGTGPVTFSAWVRGDSVPTTKEFGILESFYSGRPWHFTLERSSWGGGGLTVYMGYNQQNPSAIGGGNWPIADTSWHLASVTRDSSIMVLYFDGAAVASSTLSNYTNFDVGNRTIRVGYPSERFFDGSISDVRIYNRALSASEISLLYGSYKPKATAGSLQKGLVLDMPLTSNYTKTVTAGSQIMTDKTPYSNDGQNYGATVGSDSTSFNGTSNYINVPSFPTPVSFSVSYWIYPVTLTNWNQAMGSNSGWGGFTIHSTASGSLYAGTDIATRFGPLANNTMELNKWQNFTYTYDGTQANVYKNGLRIAGPQNQTRPLAWAGFSMGSISGQLSGVKIYNRALSVDEVKSLYDKGR